MSNPFFECPADMVEWFRNMSEAVSVITKCVTDQQSVYTEIQKSLADLHTKLGKQPIVPTSHMPVTRNCESNNDALNKLFSLRRYVCNNFHMSMEEFDRRVCVYVGNKLRISMRGTRKKLKQMLRQRGISPCISDLYTLMTDLGLMTSVYQCIYDVISVKPTFPGVRKPKGARPAEGSIREYLKQFDTPVSTVVNTDVPVGNVRGNPDPLAKMTTTGQQFVAKMEERKTPTPATVAFDKLDRLMKSKLDEDNVIPG